MRAAFLLCGMLFPAGIAATLIPSFLDHACPDHQQTCSDDETCCKMGPDAGYMCCESTASGPCCGGNSKKGGGCCTEGETCCADDQDYACCLQQNTYCVAKDPSIPTLPSRCCPRWTVGCTTGSVGCCDPAQPWQWYLGSKSKLKKWHDIRKSKKQISKSDHQAASTSVGNVTAYVLFVNDLFVEGLQGMTINVATGQIESHTNIIKSFDDDPAGESTREFMFDSKRKVFYYVDANFTLNGGARPAEGRQMYLYTVDPVAGTSKKQDVQGATDFPVGYTYHVESDTIILGIEKLDSNETLLGFDFFSLNPESAVATRLSTIERGSSESDPEFYSGFHRHADSTGKILYRLGYEQVTKQTGQGLGTVSLNEAHATAAWESEISPQHDYYMTLNRAPTSSQLRKSEIARTGNEDADVFISLAPQPGVTTQHDLDVVQWNADDGGKSAKVVAHLSNAHVPSVMGLGSLGYLASAISADTFAALVVSDKVDPEFDTWALAVVDLTPGVANNSHVLELTPKHLSGPMSVSGLGLA